MTRDVRLVQTCYPQIYLMVGFMLPVGYVATRSATFKQSPQIYPALADLESFRSGAAVWILWAASHAARHDAQAERVLN